MYNRIAPICPRANKYKDGGNTSASVLESTLQRLVNKHGNNIQWAGHKQHLYSQESNGWRGMVWDVLVLRAVTNFLISSAKMTQEDARNWVRSVIDLDILEGGGKVGRPAGTKGEKMGNGRKSHPTGTVFLVADEGDGVEYVRCWQQIQFTNRCGILIDCVANWYEQNRKGVSHSRQKILTIISRINRKTPLSHTDVF